MDIFEQTNNTILQLNQALNSISNTAYKTPNKILGNATIGGHVRHVVEMYQCLLLGLNNGVINYDDRKRDKQIETDKEFAVNLLNSLPQQLEVENVPLLIVQVSTKDGIVSESHVQTSYNRELWYNLDHTVHHMALIRIGIETLTDATLSETFGFAQATINYKKQCAQ
jgi:hypothetical protein